MPRDDFEEKSHYSYDEMMNRLKESRSGRSSSGGKKRRRSEQLPKANSRKFKVLAIIGAVLVVLALAVPVAIFMMSRGQYTTDAFRRSLNDRVSAITGRSADFGPFRMQGRSLFSQRLEVVDHTRSGWIHQARFTGLRADFESTLHQGTEWPIKKLAVTNGQVVLGPRSGALPQQQESTGVLLSKPLLGLDPNPTAIVLSDLYFRELDLAWGSSGSYDTLRGAKLQAQIIGESASWQLADGTLSFGRIPSLTIATMSGDLGNGKLTIDNGVIGYTSEEHGRVNGEIDLSESGGAKLSFTLNNVELKRWLDLHHKENGKASVGLLSDTIVDAPWGRRIKNGYISLTGEYMSSFGLDAPSPSISGEFVVNSLFLRDWHLFYSMGLAFNESGLNNLKFEPIKGQFQLQTGVLTVTDLKAEHKGLIKVQGSFTITHNPENPDEIPTIDGTLRIGLPAVDLDKFPGGYPDYFSAQVDGFGWTNVNLTGPLDEPRHDFVEKLPESMRKNLPHAPWEMSRDEN